MLSAAHSLARNYLAGAPLPRVPALGALYKIGFLPRQGQVIMVAGRSGTQKSGFALWWTQMMGLDTLYFSADMSPFTASTRLASMIVGHTTEEIEVNMKGAHGQQYIEALKESRIKFAFGSPITEYGVMSQLAAWVEMRNSYPSVIVFDNLMDFEGAESDYTGQMAVMSNITELARETNATVIILHHASDKSWEATSEPYKPPSRKEVKGGLSEKPECSLSVAIEPGSNTYRIAVIKQRMGPCDPTANTYAVMRAVPELTRFESL